MVVSCLSVCPSACLSVCLLVFPSVCLSAYLPVCPSVCLYACLSVCLLVCLPVCLSVSETGRRLQFIWKCRHTKLLLPPPKKNWCYSESSRSPELAPTAVGNAIAATLPGTHPVTLHSSNTPWLGNAIFSRRVIPSKFPCFVG